MSDLINDNSVYFGSIVYYYGDKVHSLLVTINRVEFERKSKKGANHFWRQNHISLCRHEMDGKIDVLFGKKKGIEGKSNLSSIENNKQMQVGER